MTMADAGTLNSDRAAAAERAVERARNSLGWAGAMVEASGAVSDAADEFCAAKSAYANALVNLVKALDAQRIAAEAST